MKNRKFNAKRVAPLLLIFTFILSIFIPNEKPVLADAGAGDAGTGGGRGIVQSDMGGYRFWFDNFNDGNPEQGWNEDSINWWQNYIEQRIGKRMNTTRTGNTDKSYYEIYLEGAREALRDARQRSGTDRARIVGVTSYQYRPDSTNTIIPITARNLFRNYGGPPTAQELTDEAGWSTLYKNQDGATQETWRQWIYEYGKIKSGGDNASLTLVVWAIAEGEPTPPAPPTNTARLRKVSTSPNLLSNSNYSLEGASFGIYETREDALNNRNRIETLTTDSSGNTREIELNEGLYWGRELTAPRGHVRSNSPFQIDLRNGDNTITIDNIPVFDDEPSELFIKRNEVGENLGNSIFKVEYRYSRGSSVNRVWYLESQRGTGGVTLSNNQLVSFNGNNSDSLYVENGRVVLPIGNYRIQEVKAPDGHILDSTVMEFEIDTSGNYRNVSVRNSHINQQTYARIYKTDFQNNIIRGHDRDVMRFKVFEDGVDITSNFGGNPQDGYRLNPQGGGALGLSELSTNRSTGFVDLMQLRLGSRYTIRETTPPFGYTIGEDGNQQTISVTNQNNRNNPRVSVLRNRQSMIMVEKRQMGNNELVTNNPMRFRVVGETGTFTGDITPKLRRVGDTYLFDPDYNSGSREIETNSNGYVIIRGLEYQSRVRVIETKQPDGFFPDEDPQDRVLTVGEAIERSDGTLENNTVTVVNEKIPSLRTVLGHANGEHSKNEDGIFEVYPVNQLDLSDRLIFDDVMEGYEYRVIHRLMDVETNQAVGEKIQMITPNAEHYEVDLLQSVDGSQLRGKTITAFVRVERLSSKLPNKTKVIHEDYNDKDQTIRIVNPSIRTKFTTFDNLKYVQGDYNQRLVDSVQYDDVIKDLPINLDLLIFDKTFNTKLRSDGDIQQTSKTFTPTEKSGIEPVEINTNLNMHKGKEIVAMTELSYSDEILTNHSDVRDKDQTIEVVAPDMPITGSTYTKTILLLGTTLIAAMAIAYKSVKIKENK